MTTLATAFVEVRPDSAGFGARLKAEMGKVKESVDVKANLDSSQFKVAFYGLKRQLSSIAVTKARIDADAASALVTIKGLKLDLKSLTEKVKLGVDDTLAMGKIAEIKAQIASLGTTRGKLDVDSSAAAAKIKILKAELAVLQHTTTEHPIDVRVTGTNFAFRGISGIATAIVGLAPAAVPVLAAVTAGVGTLGAALGSAAGAGGVFGASVAGQVAEMTKSQTVIKATQTSLAGLVPGTQAYIDKLKELRQQQKAFNESFGPAARGLDNLKGAWQSFLKETRPVTLGVMGDALDGLAGILPKLVPLSNAAGKAVGGLVDQFVGFSEGEQFQGFLDFFKKYGPDAITSFGHILGNIGIGFVELFKDFAPFQQAFLGGIEGMTAKFAEWATGLNKTDGFKSFMAYVQKVLPDVLNLFSQLALFAKNFLVALAPLGSIELHVIVELLTGLNSLPSGVLTGIAVGITAIVLGLKAWELGTKAVTIATGVQTAKQKIWELATSTSADKMKVLGTAARVAAGAAGIGLLIDAAGRGSTAVGALETAAGGAAIGFSVGGPWGAAIGGGIGLAKAFAGANDDLQASMEAVNKVARDTPFDFAARKKALDDLIGSTHDLSMNTAKLAGVGASGIPGAGLFAAAAAHFQSQVQTADTAAHLMLTKTLALQQGIVEFSQAMNNQKGIDGFTTNLTEIQARANDIVPALQGAGYSLKRIQAILTTHKGWGEAVTAAKEYIATQDSIPGRTKAVADAVSGLGNNMKSAATKADELQSSLDALLGPELGLSAATDAWTTGIRHLTDDLAKHSRAIAGNTDAAIANRAAIRDRVGLLTDTLVAEAKAGASAKELSGHLHDQRQALLDAGAAAGISRGDLRKYLDTLGLTPHLVNTLIKLNGVSGAYASLKTIRDQLASLHDKTITVNVNTGAIGHIKDGGLIGRYDIGGVVHGPGGPRDDRVAAMLSAGEFVVNAAATRKHLGLLHQINAQHFAAGGPVLTAVEQQQADNQAARDLAQATRALEKEIKHFNVRPGDTASDTRSMVNTLASALRDVVGKDSPLLKHFRALGDHLVDVQKRQDKLGDRYDKAAGQLKATLAAQHQYATSVAAAFTHDAFGGSLADLKLQLRADTNDARHANRSLDHARRMGLSGAALRQLAASGNTALIGQVGQLGHSGIRGLEAMLAARTRATSQLGGENAQAVFANRVDAQTKELHHLGERLRELNHSIDQMEHRVERGARKGVGDREHRASTKRRAT